MQQCSNQQIYPDAVVEVKLTARHYIKRLEQPIDPESIDMAEYEEDDDQDDEFLTQVQRDRKKRLWMEQILSERREAHLDELRQR